MPEEYPAGDVSLRSASRDGVAIVDVETGELIGDVDVGPAPSTVHQGAIYLHGGRQFEVATFDFDDRRAFVRPFDGDWYTQAKKRDRHRASSRCSTRGRRSACGSASGRWS